MILDVPPESPPAVYRPAVAAVTSSGGTREVPRSGMSLFHRTFYREVRVGRTRYPLRRPLAGQIVPAPVRVCGTTRGLSEARVAALPGDRFVGRGKRADEAWDDWCDRLHTRFQRLYGMRPFERDRDAADRADWEILQAVIDVSQYEQSAPVRVREVGRLHSDEPGRRRIKWDMRDAVDQVSYRLLTDLPPEFARLRVGQWFEMTSLRHPVDGRLLGGEAVGVVTAPDELTDAELEAFADRWGSTADYPETDWD